MSQVIKMHPKFALKNAESLLTRAIRIRLQLEKFKHLVSAAYYEQNVQYIEGRIMYLAGEQHLDGSMLLETIYAKFAQNVTPITLIK